MWSGVLTENYLQWLCHSFSMLAVSTNEIFGDATKLSGPQLHKNELWSTTWYSWIVISQVESVTSNQQPRDSEAAHILWFNHYQFEYPFYFSLALAWWTEWEEYCITCT